MVRRITHQEIWRLQGGADGVWNQMIASGATPDELARHALASPALGVAQAGLVAALQTGSIPTEPAAGPGEDTEDDTDPNGPSTKGSARRVAGSSREQPRALQRSSGGAGLTKPPGPGLCQPGPEPGREPKPRGLGRRSLGSVAAHAHSLLLVSALLLFCGLTSLVWTWVGGRRG